jgi:SWI/SNF-related matrix-associated actin-dependent regulator of chromatin subfamily A member 5
MHNITTAHEPVEVDAVDKTEDDAPRMTRGELASILRGGASALAKWGTDGQDAFGEFRASTFEDLRERGKERDEKKEVGMLVEAGEVVGDEQRRALELEEEEAEKLLLAGREAVQARKFEGAMHKQSNAEIRNGQSPVPSIAGVFADASGCRQSGRRLSTLRGSRTLERS